MASLARALSAAGRRHTLRVQPTALRRCWSTPAGAPQQPPLRASPLVAATLRQASSARAPAGIGAWLLPTCSTRPGPRRLATRGSRGLGARVLGSSSEPAPVEEIKPALAREMADAAYKANPSGESVQLVDVREPREIQAANLGKYGWRWTALPLNSQFEEWREDVADGELLDPTKPTLLLCHAGIRSRFVGQYLTQQCGFTEVYNITGGIDAWSSYDPEIPRY